MTKNRTMVPLRELKKAPTKNRTMPLQLLLLIKRLLWYHLLPLVQGHHCQLTTQKQNLKIVTITRENDVCTNDEDNRKLDCWNAKEHDRCVESLVANGTESENGDDILDPQ